MCVYFSMYACILNDFVEIFALFEKFAKKTRLNGIVINYLMNYELISNIRAV